MMFDNLMFAVRTERRGRKVEDVRYITQREYLRDFFDNLYYREVNDNRRMHRCEYARHTTLPTYLKWESYGNGFKCEWKVFPIPSEAGFREREVVRHAHSVEHVMDNGHELLVFHAFLDDGEETCAYDLTEVTFAW